MEIHNLHRASGSLIVARRVTGANRRKPAQTGPDRPPDKVVTFFNLTVTRRCRYYILN